MSCGVGHRRGSNPEVLWLWHRLAATAPIRPLAWEPPYASGEPIKKEKRKKEKKKKKERFSIAVSCGVGHRRGCCVSGVGWQL